MISEKQTISSADNDTRYVPDNCTADFCAIAHESRYYWVYDKWDIQNKSILDFGCGSGYGAFLLSKKAQLVHGLDYSSTTIDYAKGKFNSKNLEFFSGDAVSTEIITQLKSYDIIVSFDVIEHLEKYFEYLKNITLLLKQEGTLIIGCPNRLQTFEWNTHWNPYHFQEFSPYQLRKILNLFFEEVTLVAQDFVDPNKRQTARKSNQGNRLTSFALLKKLIPRKLKNLLKGIFYNNHLLKSQNPFETSDISFIFEPSDAQLDQAFGLIAICKKPRKPTNFF
jgi:2-polyprenyl-3-methyl-5-hydroxy-6-metoxy-1,4-benzoquinol methylase